MLRFPVQNPPPTVKCSDERLLVTGVPAGAPLFVERLMSQRVELRKTTSNLEVIDDPQCRFNMLRLAISSWPTFLLIPTTGHRDAMHEWSFFILRFFLSTIVGLSPVPGLSTGAQFLPSPRRRRPSPSHDHRNGCLCGGVLSCFAIPYGKWRHLNFGWPRAPQRPRS